MKTRQRRPKPPLSLKLVVTEFLLDTCLGVQDRSRSWQTLIKRCSCCCEVHVAAASTWQSKVVSQLAEGLKLPTQVERTLIEATPSMASFPSDSSDTLHSKVPGRQTAPASRREMRRRILWKAEKKNFKKRLARSFHVKQMGERGSWL